MVFAMCFLDGFSLP